MKLSPKAHRFVTEAVRDLRGASGRDRLLSWLDRSAGEEIPPEIATLALDALERFEYWMRQRLEAGDVDEDQRSDLINDIAFVHAVESDLKQVEGVPHQG
jgi:hypothetical protein